MQKFFLSEADTNIIRYLKSEQSRLSLIIKDLNLSSSTTSKSLSRLERIGLLSIRANGRMKIVFLPKDETGMALRRLLDNSPNLDPGILFKGYGLLILSSISDGGATRNEITYQTRLTRTTIERYIKKWRSTGILWKKGHGEKYEISRNYPDLDRFLTAFIKKYLILKLNEEHPDSRILYADSKVIIFSPNSEIGFDDFPPAAFTYLAMNGYDVVSDRRYHLFSFGKYRLSDLEAIIQSIRIDSLNPRPRRLLKNFLIKNRVKYPDLRYLAIRYGIWKLIKNEVKRNGGEEIFRKE